MPISIYPPTLQSTQPAFLYNTASYPIYFTLQSITSFNEIGHIQIRIVKQIDNRSIIDTSKYPDGTIYKQPSNIQQSGNRYCISILRADLNQAWSAGVIYKVQMRFGTTPMFGSVSDFATWKQTQIDNQTFSEWSTVMLIKAIDEPEVYIKNAEAIKPDVIATERTESTLTPLFTGGFSIPERSKEQVDKYKFDLFDEEDELIETSGWLQHDATNNVTLNSFRFKHILTNNNYYTVIFSIITVNGYKANSDPYRFLAFRTYYAELENIELAVENDTPYCKDNGCIRLKLYTGDKTLTGSFIITRADERSNFNVFEDLKYLSFTMETVNDYIFTDFTVESGIKYRYAIQQENAAGLRSAPVPRVNDKDYWVDFEYNYLYHDDIQLRLSFNEQISSFKHTVLASKQDTIGDRYPYILKNGNAYYAEFPITGLISLQMDPDNTFFTDYQEDGYYHNGDLLISKDKFEDGEKHRRTTDSLPEYTGLSYSTSVNSNLTANNVFIERKFREKVEEFLNNYDYKLYKSPTEGNIVVILMNVSLTPNEQLGRMLYSFSATAYEVLDNTIENLNEYGIINIGEFETLVDEEKHLSFGQVIGYTRPSRAISMVAADNDIYAAIKQQEEVSIGEGYKMQLEQIKSFWIDIYESNYLNSELQELRAALSEAGGHDAEIEGQIADLEGIVAALVNPLTTYTININGRNIKVFPKRPYAVTEPVQSFSLVNCPYPVIVNYVAELTQVEDLSAGVVQAVDTSRVWGQIAGIFTDTSGVLRIYNADYKESEDLELHVFRAEGDIDSQSGNIIIRDALNNIIVDNSEYFVYKTENLLDAVKEQTRRQIEIIYNLQDGFKQNEDGEWVNGQIHYEFSDIILFDIEADPGTVLWVGKTNKADAKKVIIGPTGRYTLNPMDALVSYIALDAGRPQFCIINYQCMTSQLKIGSG